jgi:uncharacterized protein YndB with AHSA1/START domain
VSPTPITETKLGTATETADAYVLRYERRLDHPVDVVWRAVTDPGEVGAWWAEADIDLRVGGAVEFRWQMADPDGNSATATGTVTALDPPRLVEYTTDIHGVLRFELSAAGEGTRLVFSATYPKSMPERLSVTAGWHVHLEHLDAALDGVEIDWSTWYADHYPRWQELHDAYAARM